MMRKALVMGMLSLMLLLAAACGDEGGNGDDDNGAAGPGGVAITPTQAVENGGPAILGRNIFTGDARVATPACASCHGVGGGAPVGPDLEGLATRAAERVEGLSVEEYIRQSIVNPDDYVVEGFQPGIMPPVYSEQLDQQQLDALVAYLMTLD